MKNIVSFNNLVKCNNCCNNGFFCYTPQNGEFITCPLCQDDDYVNDVKESDKTKYDNLDELHKKYLFCGKCYIMFSLGCIHASNGSTNNCYNGHLIGKWKYKEEIYIGMPRFNTIDEWYCELKNIEILEWFCPNNGLHCNKGLFLKTENPDHYNECLLKK